MASRLNALHTLPVPLKPATGLWGKGKSLLSFYKTGLTNVWRNRKTADEIRKNYKCRNGFELARSIVENSHLAGIEHNVLKTENQQKIAVTRSELLNLVRTERDMRKFPFFVVVFAIFAETTPIVLWAFPRIAPSTCWSASFNEKLRATFTKNETEIKQLGAELDGSESVFRLKDDQLRHLVSTLDFGHHYRFLPRNLLQQRMQKHITFVRADDAILRQNVDNLEELDKEELTRALMNRALPIEGGLDALRYWIQNFIEPMDAGFFLHNNAPSPPSPPSSDAAESNQS